MFKGNYWEPWIRKTNASKKKNSNNFLKSPYLLLIQLLDMRIFFTTLLGWIFREKLNLKGQNVIVFKNVQPEICCEHSQGNSNTEYIFVSLFLIACYVILRGQVIFHNDSNCNRV